MNWLTCYWWAAFIVSFFALLRVPTRMNRFDNAAGTVFCATVGFILWPLYVAAAIVSIRESKP